ncbi:MAG TPA: heptaprenyl diphosphate synthase [Clostridia bacterium]|nr:heptaprenyl diphosphate synthase [Clostridia bacterium]
MLDIEFLNGIKSDLKIVESRLAEYVQSSSPLLTKASLHLFKAGGKRLRPAFALLAGKCCGGSLERLLPLAVALELIHMASLVHDDVIDNSLTRRGIPTVKAQWGDKVSLHTGDYLFAKSLLLIAQYKNFRIAKILADVSVEMCLGEIQQIVTAFDLNQSLRDYFYRIKRKTAMLISASCQLGAVASNADPVLERSLTKYGHYLGMAFQITDDILDIVADEDELGKPVGSDLRQGIITLPTIYALKHSKDAEQLAAIISNRQKTNRDIETAIAIIKECGAIEYSFNIAQAYIKKAKTELKNIPSPDHRETLTRLADFVQVRKF